MSEGKTKHLYCVHFKQIKIYTAGLLDLQTVTLS